MQRVGQEGEPASPGFFCCIYIWIVNQQPYWCIVISHQSSQYYQYDELDDIHANWWQNQPGFNPPTPVDITPCYVDPCRAIGWCDTDIILCWGVSGKWNLAMVYSAIQEDGLRRENLLKPFGANHTGPSQRRLQQFPAREVISLTDKTEMLDHFAYLFGEKSNSDPLYEIKIRHNF